MTERTKISFIIGVSIVLASFFFFLSKGKGREQIIYKAIKPTLAPTLTLTPSLTPTFIPTPTFEPLPLVEVPLDDLQARKDEFAIKVKEFTERAKAAGKSNTAIANTIRFMYQLEFGTNVDSQQSYTNCLVEYNTKLSEYNSCMIDSSYGCYKPKPINICVKPIDAGF